MLELKNIYKEYRTTSICVKALKDISIKFRKSEFVSVLGPSGCGKTTLLNIIGGLDGYTSGDLMINGRSTKEYRSKDWDKYRNHTIGFVFQSYNLIMHLNVFENVEMALKLSGVSKEERIKRTNIVLERVGLLDKAKSLPNELSGGQMQRVAIARALINDPEILLADEPTGALDSETSIQILDLLKDIASDRLVIMVTHNPDLALKYSTRIVRLTDGVIVSDSNPYNEEMVKENININNKTSMSFLTALKLSFKNMLTKKARTILVSFAGSIGIIGIALILAMSNGFQTYIDEVQERSLSEYPLTIRKQTMNTSVVTDFLKQLDTKDEPLSDDIEVKNIVRTIKEILENNIETNDLSSFKEFIDNNEELQRITTDIKYTYNSNFYIYPTIENGDASIYPNYPLPSSLLPSNIRGYLSWQELLESDSLLSNKYELLAGNFPQEDNEILLIVNVKGQISDLALYMIGERTLTDLTGESENEDLPMAYSYDYFLDREIALLVDSDFYELQSSGDAIKRLYNVNSSGLSQDMSKLYNIIQNKATKLKISGIVRLQSTSTFDMSAFLGGVAYTTGLKKMVINKNLNSDVVQAQLASTDYDLYEKKPFSESSKTYVERLEALGYADLTKPDQILIYASSFDNKDRVLEIIDEYNKKAPAEQKIKYTDELGILMGSISEIVNAVSYVLIAFVSVSLIVSSIMIGVITYISVLERTKEIGVLRSIGASKKDISRVFNAETLIIGFVSGLLGIGVSLILLIPINSIIKSLTSIPRMGRLPLVGSLILILISTVLTLIAGIIPSRLAANKDPVKALRSE